MTVHPLAFAALLAGLLAGCASPASKTTADEPRPPSIAAGMSPVPAFTGGGAGWSIEIASTGNGNHDASLSADGRTHKGTLRYLGQPADAPSSLIVLNGELDRQPAIVEIKRESCRNADGVDTLASVQVTMEGQPQRRGCGHLAVY
ncbi:TPA: hypothetical protein QDZ60_002696 [Stenotrophomonas maltophilia]|uniref:hypothetical protein n=1 Tax=Stenotrophomonas sp. Sm6012 TaxID=3002745 RepID=UPI0003A1CB05|nr:hypothetical protein [Stenotrophomonas sp. Sm6012]MBH1363874.1 hypothetical protein [Stenotrophomonas maltophilia]MDQ7280387.1 hypothetical protein [Stenotrophomonas sp. Sm6012]HDS1125383.1 hypothetical protein [Stenotrophomonas maltophilia]HEL3179566.1 hypothetical protein [Stenotrophomonas maltophilia]